MSTDPAEFVDARPARVLGVDGDRDVDDDPAVEPEPAEAGAWSEDLGEVSVYADTSLTIPGSSDPPADCGRWGPKQYCKTCGEPVLGPHKCERRECRECWRKWRLDRAGAATRRLAGARRAADGVGKRLVHVVASPPDPTAEDTPRSERVRTLVDWEDAKKNAYALAKEKGVRGGVLIPHGWRVRDEAQQLYRELKGAGELPGDLGIWQWVRDRPEDWRTLTHWSPHFHIVGLARDVGESDPAADDGWVFKRIDSFPSFNLTDEETYRPMYRSVAYLLSHVGLEAEAGKQAIRWFGSLAPGRGGFSWEDVTDWEESVIDRKVEALGVPGEAEKAATCKEEGCEGNLSPIWAAGAALSDPEWCERIGREREARLAAAFEWAIGERVPPPGARFPSTARECEEAFELLLD